MDAGARFSQRRRGKFFRSFRPLAAFPQYPPLYYFYVYGLYPTDGILSAFLLRNEPSFALPPTARGKAVHGLFELL